MEKFRKRWSLKSKAFGILKLFTSCFQISPPLFSWTKLEKENTFRGQIMMSWVGSPITEIRCRKLKLILFSLNFDIQEMHNYPKAFPLLKAIKYDRIIYSCNLFTNYKLSIVINKSLPSVRVYELIKLGGRGLKKLNKNEIGI